MARRAPMTSHTAYSLALLADVPAPDSLTSLGAVFLMDIYERVVEDVRDGRDLERIADDGAEFAAEALPASTRDVFRVWVDLCGWIEEDDLRSAGWLAPCEWPTAEQRARVVLEYVGARLARCLIEEYRAGLCPNHEEQDAPLAGPEGYCESCYIEAESYLHPVQADHVEDAG